MIFVVIDLTADFLDVFELPLRVDLNKQRLHRTQTVRVVIFPQK